jgi:hypothetical protein
MAKINISTFGLNISFRLFEIVWYIISSLFAIILKFYSFLSTSLSSLLTHIFPIEKMPHAHFNQLVNDSEIQIAQSSS